MITDLGFRPELNGFSFENYGGEPSVQNLTAVEVRRLFGDQVCATLAGGRCVLTPPGQQWMEQVNGDMAGGHCEGMAVLSLLMYTDQVTETLFGGQNAADLAFNNAALAARDCLLVGHAGHSPDPRPCHQGYAQRNPGAPEGHVARP